jgi:hypothetical protein
MSNKSPHFNRSRTIPDLIAEERRRRPDADTSWFKVGPTEPMAVDFQNSWGNVGGSGIAPASWYLSENGEVRLRGKITGGVAGTVAFTLPVNVRPQYAETFIVAVDGGGKANVEIRQNGDVYVETITT